MNRPTPDFRYSKPCFLKRIMQHWHLDNPEDGFVKANKHTNTALTFANRASIYVQTTLWCHHAQGGGTTTSYDLFEAQATEQCMLEKQLEHQSMWKAVADISLGMKGWGEKGVCKARERECRGTALLLIGVDLKLYTLFISAAQLGESWHSLSNLTINIK